MVDETTAAQTEAKRLLKQRREARAWATSRTVIRILEEENEALKDTVGALLHLDDLKPTPFKIKPRTKKEIAKGKNRCVAGALASDWHMGERVRPENVNHLNEYDPSIAQERAFNFFRNYHHLIDIQRGGALIDTAMLWLGGDLMTGYIHEEFVEDNFLSPLEEVELVFDTLVSGIDYLLAKADLAKLFVPTSHGNHGRSTDKRRVSSSARNSYEYALYVRLAKHYKKEPRIQFQIAQGYHNWVELENDIRLRYHHGDEVRYQGGVGGVSIPLNKAIAQWNKQPRSEGGVAVPATCDFLGHYHEYEPSGRFVRNGCFPAGTRVLVPGGVRPIEQFVPGDIAISRHGVPQEVVATTDLVAPDGLISLRVKGLPDTIQCTSNHLVWAIKGESTKKHGRVRRNWPEVHNEKPRWIQADFLSEGDWVCAPTLGGDKPGDLDLLWVYGLFLAEGHTIVDGGSKGYANRIEFSMHINELGVLERAKAILDSRLGVAGRIWTRPNRTTSHLSYSGRDISTRYREQFGHTAHNKKIPDWVFNLDAASRRMLVEGWIDGDGHRGRQVSGVTVSEQLAWGIFILASGTGLEPMLYYATKREGGTKGRAVAWRVSFPSANQDIVKVGGDRFLRVVGRNLEPGACTVYDLQVDGDPSYVANGAVVHNSLIGWNAYAIAVKASFEPPQQAFYMVDLDVKGGRQVMGHFAIRVT